MTFALQILAHTPAPVYVLFAYLVWQGVASLRAREQAVWRLLIAPVLFSASGVTILLREVGGAGSLAAWATAAAASALLGSATGPAILAVPAGGRVVRAGSPVPLLRNLVVFALHYGIAVATALRPDLGGELAIAGSAVSGASLGYFAGWALAFRRAYRATASRAGPALR